MELNEMEEGQRYYHERRGVIAQFITCDPTDGASLLMEELAEDGDILGGYIFRAEACQLTPVTREIWEQQYPPGKDNMPFEYWDEGKNPPPPAYYTIKIKCHSCNETRPVQISVTPTSSGGIITEQEGQPDTVGDENAWLAMAKYCEQSMQSMPRWESCPRCQSVTLQMIVGYPYPCL